MGTFARARRSKTPKTETRFDALFVAPERVRATQRVGGRS